MISAGIRQVFIWTTLVFLVVSLGVVITYNSTTKCCKPKISIFAQTDWILYKNCSFDSAAWREGVMTKVYPYVPKNCSKLFKGDKKEVKYVRDRLASWKSSQSDQEFSKLTRNCAWVRHNFINNLYVTDLERSFPIAITLVVYNSIQQVVRFLKAVYRVHNQYCICPDSSATPAFKDIVKNIAACLHNVHVASKLITVNWGHRSIMKAQLRCFEDLVHMRKHLPGPLKWKYSINLCGKELPMATNHEIVSHLIKLNGSMAISPLLVGKDQYEELSRLRRKKIPFNLPYYKNSAYVGMPYEFLNYMFANPKAIRLRHFFERCTIPEEHFYSTLATMPGVPGGYNRTISERNPFIISHSIWQFTNATIEIGTGDGVRCRGKVIHFVCISDVGGLPVIMGETKNGNRALFHNKYFMEYDHAIMDCMEEELIARNKKEFMMDCGNAQNMTGA